MDPPLPPATLHRMAVVRLVLTTAAWGLSFPVFKMLFAVQAVRVPEANSVFCAAHAIGTRAVLAGLVLLMWRPRLLRGLTASEWKQGALLGLFGGMGLILQADGLPHTEASVSAFLTQFYCVLLPLWVCLRRRRAPSRKLVLCTLLVLGGITILSGFNWHDFSMGRGELETLVSAVFFTVQIQLLEIPAWRDNRMLQVTVVMFGGFALCAIPVVAATMPSLAAAGNLYQQLPECALMAVIVLPCTVYAYTTMNRWQPHVTATEAGLIYCLEPVSTALYALFLPALLAAWCGVAYANERLTASLVIGGGLVTLANVLLQLRWGPPPRPTGSTPPTVSEKT